VELEALLESLERTRTVAGVVDEKPAEDVEGRRELVEFAEITPESNRIVQLSPSVLDIAQPRDERSGRGQRAGARTTARRGGSERCGQAAASLRE